MRLNGARGVRRRGARQPQRGLIWLGLRSMKTRVFSTNTQSRFVSVVLDSVLVSLVVPETTPKVSLKGPLEVP